MSLNNLETFPQSVGLLRFAQQLRRRRQRGQVAILFVLIMALILTLAAFTMNLGEVARLKTATANAADAGALAGASWVASGQNEIALIARGMWEAYFIVQLIFILPYCAYFVGHAALLNAALILTNGVIYKGLADDMMHFAWDNAQASALFTALQNLPIDDRSGTAAETIRQWSEQFKRNQTLPAMPAKVTWTRKGADDAEGNPTEEPSWVEVDVQFPNEQPELEMDTWGPFFWGWFPGCWWVCCFPDLGGYAELYFYLGLLPIPIPWPCGYTWCGVFFLSLPVGLTKPRRIAHGDGEVTVTVRQFREGGTQLGFWKMLYPGKDAPITSVVRARYTSPDIGSYWSDPRASAELCGPPDCPAPL